MRPGRKRLRNTIIALVLIAGVVVVSAFLRGETADDDRQLSVVAPESALRTKALAPESVPIAEATTEAESETTGRDTFATAHLCYARLTLKALKDNPDLLFSGELVAGLSADISNYGFGVTAALSLHKHILSRKQC